MRTRVLPVEEWPRLMEVEPFQTYGLPNPQHWIVIVVEDDEGRIVAHTDLSDAVHWDFHVTPEWRGNAGVFRALLEHGQEALQANAVAGAHTTIADPIVQAMAERFGFIPAPGKLYLYPVPSSSGILSGTPPRED